MEAKAKTDALKKKKTGKIKKTRFKKKWWWWTICKRGI